jgi:hypothetical protein
MPAQESPDRGSLPPGDKGGARDYDGANAGRGST